MNTGFQLQFLRGCTLPVPLDQEGDKTQNCTRLHTQHKGCRHGVRIQTCYRILLMSKNQNPPQSQEACQPGIPNQVIQFLDPSLSNTLLTLATHPAQRSSPEGPLVHVLDANHSRTSHSKLQNTRRQCRPARMHFRVKKNNGSMFGGAQFVPRRSTKAWTPIKDRDQEQSGEGRSQDQVPNLPESVFVPQLIVDNREQ